MNQCSCSQEVDKIDYFLDRQVSKALRLDTRLAESNLGSCPWIEFDRASANGVASFRGLSSDQH